jgi:hypothetical protein
MQRDLVSNLPVSSTFLILSGVAEETSEVNLLGSGGENHSFQRVWSRDFRVAETNFVASLKLYMSMSVNEDSF